MAIDHRAALESLRVDRFTHAFIAGAEVACPDHIPVIDPATGRMSGATGQATDRMIDDAVGAARTAQKAWWRLGPGKRAARLQALADLVRRHEDELAQLETLNMGMLIGTAKGLSARACYRNLEYFASWADKLGGEVLALPGGDTALDYTRHEPFGVIAVITPWNTPMLFLGSKVGPALITGNAVVLKPSELSSWTSLRFAELAREAGIPDGVINIVTGDGAVGGKLCAHPGIDKVTFTGSGQTARRVLQAASANLTPVSMELGGKSPAIIMADADLDRAAAGVAMGCFGLSGQACVASTRVFVEDAVADRMIGKIVDEAGRLAMGDPLDAATRLGPLVSQRQQERVLGYIDGARADNAVVRCGGGRGTGPLADGFYVEPTVLTELDPQARAAREEIFGPVMSIFRFTHLDEVIEAANDTEYGLAAGVWTSNVTRAHTVAHALEAGSVWINSWGALPNSAPFGGFKRSGNGRDGGRHALEEFTQLKNIYLHLGIG